MTRYLIAAALAAATSGAAYAAALPFSTGFESPGFANGSQLSANADWNGDGQDTSAWAVTNSVVNTLGPSTGTQWVLVTAPTASGATRERTQWVVTPAGDLTAQPLITGSADVRLIAPTSGTLNRTTSASIAMYDSDEFMIASLSLIVDSENLFHFGVNEMVLQFSSLDASQKVYDLSATSDLTHYYSLSLTADFAAGTYRGSVNGVPLDYIGSLQGLTTFRDFDLEVDSRTSTASGQRARAGFDNYSISQTSTPEPAAAALFGMAGVAALRRRQRCRARNADTRHSSRSARQVASSSA